MHVIHRAGISSRLGTGSAVLLLSRSISSANAAQLSAMIDCSSDRCVGISVAEASNLHSLACALHFSAVIKANPPIIKTRVQSFLSLTMHCERQRTSNMNRLSPESLFNIDQFQKNERLTGHRNSLSARRRADEWQHHNALKSSGTSPNFRNTVAW
jgi:hypothetical protein